MKSTTSDGRTFLGMRASAWALIVLIVIASAAAGFALDERTSQRDTARSSRDAVADKSQELVECVKGPRTDCEAEADKVEKTIDDANASIPGPAGAQGIEGPTGPQGAQGPTGPQGPAGIRGPMGLIGPRGIPGEDGTNGPPGEAGSDGQVGAAGDIGPAGPAGPQGPKGDPGNDGATGPAGPAGSNGTATPGTYTCPDGQYLAGFAIAPLGDVTLDCRDLPTLIGAP